MKMCESYLPSRASRRHKVAGVPFLSYWRGFLLVDGTPFGEISHRLMELICESITSWDELNDAFLKRFF